MFSTNFFSGSAGNRIVAHKFAGAVCIKILVVGIVWTIAGVDPFFAGVVQVYHSNKQLKFSAI